MRSSLTSFLTVSQLTSLIKADLEGEYRDLWVEGEISNLRTSPGGHRYFTLKDHQAQIKAVFFKGKARFFLRHLKEGNRVICHGDLSFYQGRGEIQLMVDFLEPRGKGEDFLRLEFLKKHLAAQGLFDLERKRPLPSLPRTIGVITSPRGAAIRDIIKVVKETYPRVDILVYPVTVQGERAGWEIGEALRDLGTLGMVDVVILARGGGAKEDLAAFNTEEVARAVAASAVPVVSAVGHEIDTTLADLAADARAPTPSAAAHMVVVRARELERKLAELAQGLTRAMQIPLNLMGLRLENLATRLERTSPPRMVKTQAHLLAELERRLFSAGQKIIPGKRERLRILHHRLWLQDPARVLVDKKDRLVALKKDLLQGIQGIIRSKREALTPSSRALETLSPLAILERGYSITLTMEGVPVTSHEQVEIGEEIRVILHQGSLLGTVKKKEK